MDTNKPHRVRWSTRAQPIRSRTRLPRLFASFWRLAGLQWRIAVIRFRMRSRLILWAGTLLMVAAACALIGLIFLEIAVFQFLRQVLAPPWVALIFAAAHLLIACIIASVARKVVRTLDSDLTSEEGGQT